MIRKFPQYKGKIMLNLGCGGQKLDGYIGIDKRDVGQDMIWDITDGLPFPDNSVDEVYSCHFVEHLTDEQSIELFFEIYRVLKVGALTHHRCPHQIPKLKNFLVVENKQKGSELFFTLKKLK